ncbi:tetratricopeptide repeat protein [Aliamphritea spongicola]|nr:tetratricopeptide repeat protein [Aliamphritea spongicola]
MTAKATGICILASLCISLAAHGSDTDACLSSFEAGQLEQARQQCEPLANQGFPEANFIMARIVTNTPPVDYPKAIYWLQRATELDHAEAAYNLGIAYQTGTGISKDLPQAIKTYQRSAELGNAKAQRNLGLMYSAGIGTEQNYPKAFEYFTASARAGEATSQYNLGIMYLQGTGTERDPELAQEWLTRAASNGDSNAQMTLGVLLQDSDLNASLLWYNRAAEQNNPYALYNLAILYWKGERLAKIRNGLLTLPGGLKSRATAKVRNYWLRSTARQRLIPNPLHL